MGVRRTPSAWVLAVWQIWLYLSWLLSALSPLLSFFCSTSNTTCHLFIFPAFLSPCSQIHHVPEISKSWFCLKWTVGKTVLYFQSSLQRGEQVETFPSEIKTFSQGSSNYEKPWTVISLDLGLSCCCEKKNHMNQGSKGICIFISLKTSQCLNVDLCIKKGWYLPRL